METNKVKDFISQLEDLQNKIEGEDFSNVDSELEKLLSNLNEETKTSSSLEVKIKRLHEDAVIPKYAKDGDAGLDLVATSILNQTNEIIEYGLGIAIEIPKNYVGLIFPRSSVTKTSLMLKNCVGVIDSGYRGEIKATFKIIDEKFNHYKIGERICQIIIIPYPQVSFVEVDELSSSERGEGGYGSTGR
jgi:dUTP pyrophosphatase